MATGQDNPPELKAPFPTQKQPGHEPGEETKMDPQPDFGADTYVGSGKLKGKVALVTGADSGIGRAIALAFAREGADVAIGYWKEHDDAKETARWIEKAGVKHILLPGDLAEEAVVQEWFDKTVKELGKIDLLVNNASTQEQSMKSFTEIKRDRLERTFMVNIIAMFSLAQKVVEHLVGRGAQGNIINIASIQAYKPSPPILDYACTKGAIVTLTKGIALEGAEKGIRCNCIAPGPVWSPLVVSSFDPEKASAFGFQRAGFKPTCANLKANGSNRNASHLAKLHAQSKEHTLTFKPAHYGCLCLGLGCRRRQRQRQRKMLALEIFNTGTLPAVTE